MVALISVEGTEEQVTGNVEYAQRSSGARTTRPRVRMESVTTPQPTGALGVSGKDQVVKRRSYDQSLTDVLLVQTLV